MITLFKKSDDAFAEELQNALENLIITFDVKQLNGDADEATHIKDGNNVIKGKDEINSWLRELEAELKWQRSLSGDGCYIDPETGKSCEIL